MSNNIVSTELLGQIHRQVLVEDNFSQDIHKHKEEQLLILNRISEPFRRLEFDVLLSICEPSYKPYDKMKVMKENDNYYVSIPIRCIEELAPELQNSSGKIVLLTVDYAFNKSRIVFRHKDCFRNFADSSYINSDKLYSKLFGMTVSRKIKTLYYFLSHYKYDFINIVSEYSKIYDNLVLLDKYFSSQGYHRCITNYNPQ